MKTFKTIMITFMVTVMVGAVGVGAFLFNEGIVTIDKRDVNHTKTVMIDGVVTEEHNWNELLGYEVKIDVVDGAYIGR
jgi:hypothetical protein